VILDLQPPVRFPFDCREQHVLEKPSAHSAERLVVAERKDAGRGSLLGRYIRRQGCHGRTGSRGEEQPAADAVFAWGRLVLDHRDALSLFLMLPGEAPFA